MIHAEAGHEDQNITGPSSLQTRSPVNARSINSTVMGFLPYWISTSYEPDYGALTHLVWFGLSLNSDGTLNNAHNWPNVNHLAVKNAQANGVKLILCFTLFSDSDIHTLLQDPAKQQTAINTIVAEVQKGADGANIDFENPKQTSDKQPFVDFITALNTALKNAGGYHLTVCGPSKDWWNTYDYDLLAANSDGIFIMGYAYHYSGSGATGAVAPLDGGSINLKKTLQEYFNNLCPADKIIMGLPWYGFKWPCVSDQAGASTTGTGTAVFYNSALQEARTYGRRYDSTAESPWYAYQSGGQWYQCWYDDASSLAVKMDWVLANELQGTGVWAIGYEAENTDIWDEIRTRFVNRTVQPDLRPMAGYKIALDPGHGGSDTGWAFNGLVEKDLAFDIAQKTKAILEAEDAGVVLTRETDIAVSPTARADIADNFGADAFVSIHMDNGSVYDRGLAAAYADRWWEERNPDYYDYSDGGGDCANFVSQCLIAGGHSLLEGDDGNGHGVDAWGCVPYCDYLHGHLVNYMGADWSYIDLQGSGTPPADLQAGDVIIYGDTDASGDHWRHAVIVVGGMGPTAIIDSHTTDRYHAPWNYALGYFSRVNFYRIPDQPGREGARTLHYITSSQGPYLAQAVQSRLVDDCGFADGGTLGARFAELKETAMPAIWIETGNLDNNADAAKLMQETERFLIARSIAWGIMDWVGIAPVNTLLPTLSSLAAETADGYVHIYLNGTGMDISQASLSGDAGTWELRLNGTYLDNSTINGSGTLSIPDRALPALSWSYSSVWPPVLALTWQGPELNLSATVNGLVLEACTNTAPVMTAPGTFVINEDTQQTYTIASYISDDRPMSELELWILPVDAPPSPSLTVWIEGPSVVVAAGQNWSGQAEFRLYARDIGQDGLSGTGDELQAAVPFTVEVLPVNDAPTIVTITNATIQADYWSIHATEDEVWIGAVIAADPDGPVLDFALLGTLANFTLAGNILRYHPSNADVGSHEIRIDVTDGILTVNTTLELEVSNVNDPPEAIITSPSDGVTLDSPVRLNGEASNDPDLPYGDVLNYTWIGANGSVYDGPVVQFALQPGEYTFQLTVTDLAGMMNIAVVGFTVIGPGNTTPGGNDTPGEPVKEPPKFTFEPSGSGLTLTRGQPLLLQATRTDSDSGSGSGVNSATVSDIVWWLGTDELGHGAEYRLNTWFMDTEQYTIRVDIHWSAGVISHEWTVVIIEPGDNNPPHPDITPTVTALPVNETLTITAGNATEFVIEVLAPGSEVRIDWYVNGTLVANGAHWTFASTAPGKYTISAKVAAGDLVATRTWTVTVIMTEPAASPGAQPGTFQAAQEGYHYSFLVLVLVLAAIGQLVVIEGVCITRLRKLD